MRKLQSDRRYDSNDETSGTEVGSCVKGSRIRKAVPPPEDEILLKPLRGELLESFLMPAYINPVQVIRFGPIRTIKNALGLVEYYGPPKSRNPRNPRAIQQC